MILKSFIGRGIFGYLDFDVLFNRDINFMIGPNGSGKTTALKLINALVTPNFKELIKTPFNSITLNLEDGKEKISIYCYKEEEHKILRISNESETLEIPSYDKDEYSILGNRKEKLDESIENLSIKFLHHPVIRSINKITSPIFLGLERRGDEQNINESDYYIERQAWFSAKKQNALVSRRLITGNLGPSLMETELLVQNTFRRIREIEQKLTNRLRDNLLLSSFQYNDFDPDFISSSGINNWKEKEGLIKRQGEIKTALSNIGLQDSRLMVELDKFFEKITSLFSQLKEMDKGLSIEWLLNKAQVERMSKIVEIIDEHNSKVDNHFKPINEFINTINYFYKDSSKRIEIDAIGQLSIIRPDNIKCTIEALSSGEQQLLIIFAHAFFNSKSRSSVFIIDEPELSLHLRWQEKFTEAIIGINNNSQYILATHSPEIVGNNVRKSIKCR